MDNTKLQLIATISPRLIVDSPGERTQARVNTPKQSIGVSLGRVFYLTPESQTPVAPSATRYSERGFLAHMYADCPFRPTLTAAIAYTLVRSVVAHPNLWQVDSHCTADAHPTSRQGDHGVPRNDSSITFLLAWAAPNVNDAPQGEETNPDRVISQVRGTARVTDRLPFFSLDRIKLQGCKNIRSNLI